MSNIEVTALFLSGFLAVVFTALYFRTLGEDEGAWRDHKLSEYGMFALVSWFVVILILVTWMGLAK